MIRDVWKGSREGGLREPSDRERRTLRGCAGLRRSGDYLTVKEVLQEGQEGLIQGIVSENLVVS